MQRKPATLITALCLSLMAAMLPSIAAADAAAGKVLYNNTPGGTACANSGCHGSNPTSNKNRILAGANNASIIQSAINNGTGGMGIYRTALTTANVADIAAYLGNPSLTGTGTATPTLSPTTLSFASTTVASTSATQTATLGNTGTAAYTISSLTAGGSNSADFIRSGSCAAGGSVAAGGSCTIIYSFKPSAAGTRSASLSVATSVSTLTLSLSGTATAATAPVASVSPTSISFGTVTVGSASSAQSTTLSNTGTAALTINSITVTAGDFSISGGTCAAAASLAAGGSCTVMAKFQPTVAGSRSATLSVATTAGSALAVALSGTGGAPATPTAQLAPSTLSFSTPQGSSSAAQMVTLSNTGSGTLTIASLGFSGAAASDYSIGTGSTCATGSNLAANGSCVVNVIFTPQALGSRTASLAIAHNDSTHSPSTATLNGSGTASAVGQLALDQVSLSFSSQPRGSSSATRVVTVRNSGSATVNFSALTLGGSAAADYALATTAGACSASSVLAPAASCTLNVSFTPTVSSGTRSASVQIVSDASNTPVTLSLSGTAAAAAPLPQFSPASLDFGSSVVGSATAAQTVTLTNGGTSALTITRISATPASYTVTHNCPGSLAVAASCTLQVSFNPAATGSINGSVTLTSNATGAQSVALTGIGAASGTAVLAWTPGTGLDLGTATVGMRSAAMSAQLSNTGAAAATIQQIGVAGAQASDFIIDSGTTCPSSGTLAAGASCSVAVVFAPSAAGTRSASITLTTASGAGPSLPLTGTASGSSGAQLTLAPTNMTLTGSANQPLDPQALVLTNEGSGVLTVTGYVVPDSLGIETGGSSGGTCPTPPFQLQPGFSCSVMVVPMSTDAINGTVQVQSNSVTTTPEVPVSGTPNKNVGAGAFSIVPFASPSGQIASTLLLIALLGLRLARRRRTDSVRF